MLNPWMQFYVDQQIHNLSESCIMTQENKFGKNSKMSMKEVKKWSRLGFKHIEISMKVWKWKKMKML